MSAIMSLGMFVFSVPTLTYDQLQRRREYRHAKSARIGARDATQFVGVGDETITLPGTVYTELSEAEASIEELHTLASTGQTLPLICANGQVYGAYVITGLDETHKAFWPDGSPRSIGFSLDLLRVDDASSGKASGKGDTTGKWL